MELKIIILNLIFYAVLTTILVYFWRNEEKSMKIIRRFTDSITHKIFSILGIKSKGIQKFLKKIVHFFESVIVIGGIVLLIQKFYLGNFYVPTGSMIPTIMPKNRMFGDMVTYRFRDPKRNEVVVFREPIQNKVLYTKRLIGLPGDTVRITNGKLYINDKVINNRLYSNLGRIGNRTWTIPKVGDKLTIIPHDMSIAAKQYDIATIQKDLLSRADILDKILPDVKFALNGKETGMMLDYIHDKEVADKLLKGERYNTTITEDYYMVLGDNTDHSYDSRMWGFVAEHRIKGRIKFRFWPLKQMGIIK